MSNHIQSKPSARQLAFLDWEFGAFFHFGIRSFFRGHIDWDNKPMPAEAFQPTQLDCEQWIRTVKAAGARYAIMTAKHHDGFANWPSKYTDYTVAASSWMNGKGDVVRQFVDACRKYELKVGLYYSPAQWGESAPLSNPKAYDDYFINQIGELLTGYGKIDYLWFDGCGSEKHSYDKDRIVEAIRGMQPELLIFSMWDPDTRWVGNEDGYAPMPNVNTVHDIDFSMLATEKEQLSHSKFLPSECDFKMRSTWFDCEDNADTIKETDEIVGIYEYSVGRGANFLVNIGPDARGLLPEADVARLLAFGDVIRSRYGTPAGEFSTPTRAEDDTFYIETAKPTLVDRVVIQEDLTEGERVQSFTLYAHLPFYQSKRVCIYRGYTIGHKFICAFPTIRTGKLVLEVTDASGEVHLRDMKAYYTAYND